MQRASHVIESLFFPTVLYEADTSGLRAEKIKRLDVLGVKCLKGMTGVIPRDVINNDAVRRLNGGGEEIEGQRGFTCSEVVRTMVRMYDVTFVKCVIKAKMSGHVPKFFAETGHLVLRNSHFFQKLSYVSRASIQESE